MFTVDNKGKMKGGIFSSINNEYEIRNVVEEQKNFVNSLLHNLKKYDSYQLSSPELINLLQSMLKLDPA